MGRVLVDKRFIGAVSSAQSVTYTYNLDGSMWKVVAPDAKIVTYAVGGAGRPTSAEDGSGDNYVTSATYAPPGELQSLTNGGVIYGALAYNSRLQPMQLFYGTDTPPVITQMTASCPSTVGNVMNKTYNFSLGAGDNGNVVSIANCLNTNRSQSFTYDALNRIASGESSGPQWGEAYTLDAWGNLTNRAGIAGKTYYESLSAAPATNFNQLTGYGYDTAGNMTTNGPTSYVYDDENRLIWTTGGYRYVYDGDGKRVEKCVAGSVTTPCPTSGTTNGTLYWMGTGSAALDESNLSGGLTEQYVFFSGTRVARRDISTSAVHYYFSDHLGSHDVIANATGTVTEQDIDYYPYGGEQEDYSTAPVAQNYKFTGKERDAESGLDNFGARYDASSMGRFMTPDPLGGHQEDPQTLNKYAYVRNNPLNLTDPTGLDLYLQGCGDASNTCKDNFVGTTDDKGNFTRTTIQSDASGNFDGHDVSFDSSGIHIDDKYQGVYAPGTDATRVNGDEDSGFAGTHFVVNSNCLGTCLAGGGLYSDNGGTSVFKGVIATLEGPNKGLDKYGDHPGDQYRGGNKNGPDAHLSYVTDQNGNPTNGMPFHIDTRNPFHSTGGFLGHTGDLIEYKFKAGILREQGPPMPADIRPKDNQ
jgi:RHS repeat-associated protein